MNEEISKETKALMLSNIIQGLLSTGKYTHPADKDGEVLEISDGGDGWKEYGLNRRFGHKVLIDAHYIVREIIEDVELGSPEYY